MKEVLKKLQASGKKFYSKNCSTCNEELHYGHKSNDFPKPKECPYCGEGYWDKPEGEVTLFKIQDRYVLEKDPKKRNNILGEMYQPLVDYSINMIKATMKSRILLSDTDLKEKGHESAVAVMRQFLLNPDYQINISFGGNIKMVLKGVLYGSKKEDMVLSLDHSLSKGDSEDTTYGDFLSDTDHYILADQGYEENPLESSEVSEEGITKDLLVIINEFTNEVRSRDSSAAILFLAGVYNIFLKKNRQSMNLYYQVAGTEVQKTLDYFQIYMQDYLRNNSGVAK